MDDLASFLDDALGAGGLGTAAQAVVRRGGTILHDSAHGHRAPGGPEVTAHTPFDLASLTKVLATTTVWMTLVDRGEASLDDPVGRFLPDVAWPDVTVRALLGHRAGLPSWQPWFDAARRSPDSAGLWPDRAGGSDRAAARRHTLAAAFATPALDTPGRRYSDLGFLALGEAAAVAGGAPLDALARDHVMAPLGLGLRFHRLDGEVPHNVPPTGILRPREPAPGQEGAYLVHPQVPVIRPGEVDDDHAWALGGVAGHAGLFGTAQDVAALGAAILDDLDGAGTLWRPETVARFVSDDEGPPPLRALGFDRPSGPASSVGERFGRGMRGAVGHLGFTGTSLWLDLDRRAVAVLLTNRTFPSRTAVQPIRSVRRRFHDLAASRIDTHRS